MILIMIDNNIRKIRHAKSMTLAQLAARLGMTQPSLTRIENGTQPLTLERVVDIADALDCCPGDILPTQWVHMFDGDRFMRIYDAVNRALAELRLESPAREKLQFIIFLYRHGCGASLNSGANDNEIMDQIRSLYNMVA